MPLAKGETPYGRDLPNRIDCRRRMDCRDSPLDQEPTLCSLCRSVDVAQLVAVPKPDASLRVQHHLSFAALELAVAQGCGLCSVLHQGIFEESQLVHHYDHETARAFQHQLDSQIASPFYLSTYYVVDPDREAPYYPEQKAYFRVHYDRDGDVWRLHRATPSLSLISWYDRDYIGRPISALPDIDFYRDWLYTCASRHYKCPALESRKLPTRLLDVGHAGQHPKLVETAGQSGEYVTLSHSWGGCQPPTTTAANYLSNMSAIDFAGLPKTFQDAITTTRSLGFRYLWIDCFCIVQGDAADFQRECARMAEIFENAALTIAGAAAANPYAGFLHQRPEYGVLPCKLTKYVEGIASETFFMCNKKHWYRQNFFKQRDSPLQSRAWIYQERQLSPRILYFGSSQAYFECMEADCWEGIRYAAARGVHEHIPKRAFGMELLLGGLHNVWYHIASNYSGRQLTAESDKLPALSGIAHRMRERNADTYVAGLWQSDLQNGLLWYADVDGDEPKSARAAIHRAPSWSWASCDRHITFLTMGHNDAGVAILKPQFHFGVLSVQASAIGQDPCGEVHSGELVLEARSHKALLRMLWDDTEDEELPTICLEDNPDVKAANFAPDAPRSSMSASLTGISKSVTCVLVASISQDGESIAFIMVLEQAESTSQSVFRRIGLANVSSETSVDGTRQSELHAAFAEVESKVIKIV